jgi:hypothetical protein
MERAQTSKLLSHVLASYASRELDRKWIDVWMKTPVGQKLLALGSNEKYAAEFLSYLISGWLVHNNPNPSAFRLFVNSVLSDLPTEVAKRMMDNHTMPSQVNAILLDLNDVELTSVMVATEYDSSIARRSPEKGWMGNLADKLEEKQAKLKKREWRKDK